jgi:hypothetical protein
VPDEAKRPAAFCNGEDMAKLQLNNITPSVVRLLRHEIEGAIQSVAERYGISLEVHAEHDASRVNHFRLVIDGAVQSDG